MKKSMITMAAIAGTLVGPFATNASADEVVVQRGDTLWGIANEHSITVDELKGWNQLSSTIIYPGDRLEINGDQTQQTAPSNEEAVHTYTVQSGDSLWSIATAYGLSVSELKTMNNLTSNTIYPGDTFDVSGDASETTSTDQNSEEMVKSFTATATAYTANCSGCSGITSTGINLKENPNQKVVSVDPSVIPLGSKVWVEGYGYAIAGDTGGNINDTNIDVFIPNYNEAIQWGKKEVTVNVYR